jgi:hypothetical protein
MPRFGSDRNRTEVDQTQATQHPVRKSILKLFKSDPLRPLTADVLMAALLTEFPDLKAEEARLANVAYHIAVLKDAELLPSGCS